MKVSKYMTLFFASVLFGCMYSTSPEKIKVDVYHTDTLGLEYRISNTAKKLEFLKLKEIDDSIRFWLYNIFYDEPINNQATNDFFCFYQLVPFSCDTGENSVRIRYTLLERNSNDGKFVDITKELVEIEYENFRQKTFQKNRLSILGKVYRVDRFKDPDFREINNFIEQHPAAVDKHFKSEIKKILLTN